MKSLLLIMPFFMGYETVIINELSKKFDVTMINGDQYIPEIRYIYKEQKIRRNVAKRIKPLQRVFEEKLVGYYSDKLIGETILNKKYDVVFVINGHGISNRCYENLRKNNPKAEFIIYLWDDVNNLFKRSHLSFFDKVYSYNISDCSQYNAEYLPMFVNNKQEGHDEEDMYDISMIASVHSDRVEFAKKIYNKYNDDYRLYFYFYDPDNISNFYSHKIPLRYEEYLDILRCSKVIIDIPNIIQKGPTTRIFDAYSTCTKVITTNQYVKEYPFFSENILVIDRMHPEIDVTFLNTPYKETKYPVLQVEDWVSKLNFKER